MSPFPEVVVFETETTWEGGRPAHVEVKKYILGCGCGWAADLDEEGVIHLAWCGDPEHDPEDHEAP